MYFCEKLLVMGKYIHLSLLLIFLLVTSVNAQEKDRVLSGVTIDENGARINNVCISDSNGVLLSMTNSDGLFEIPLARKYDITLSHPRFEKSTLSIDPDSFEFVKDKYHAIFMLSDKTASPIVDQDTLKNAEYVVDYNVGKYGIFLIKTDGTQSTLQQLSFRNKILAKLSIDIKFNQIFIDVLDGIHIFSNDSSYQVFSDGERLTLSNGHDLEYFKSHIMSLAAVTDSIAVSSFQYYHGQSINYIMTNLNTSEKSVMCCIDSEAVRHQKDSKVGEHLKHITDQRLKREERFSVIGVENSEFRPNRVFGGDYYHHWSFWYVKNPELNKSYKNKIPYEELLSFRNVYAPLFEVGGKIYIFDFPNDFLCEYNSVGTYIENTEIAFHLSHGYASKFHDNPWDNNIIFDAAREECYAQFKENGKVTLKKINLSNGNVVSSYTIETHDNPHNIHIYNGIVYYMYYKNEAAEYEKRYFSAEMIR